MLISHEREMDAVMTVITRLCIVATVAGLMLPGSGAAKANDDTTDCITAFTKNSGSRR
jgi:hypothetical protein